MKTLSVAICLALCALFATSAAAFLVNPCFQLGNIVTTPLAPGPNDVIGVGVIVPSGLAISPKYKLIKSGVDSQGRITLDVVLTDAVAAFPDYTIVSRPLDEVDVYIGPFAPGVITVQTTVSSPDASGVLKPVCDPAYRLFPNPEITVHAIGHGDTTTEHLSKASVVEFYNAALDHYFMTTDVHEIHDLDAGVHPGWTRTGETFVAYSPATDDFFSVLGAGAIVRRYYGLPSHGLDSHFFTRDEYERERLASWPMSQQWLLETDNAFQVWPPLTGSGFCRPATVPVYRLWNGRLDSNHRYTTDLAIRQNMIAKGWIPEGYGALGVVMCALAS